MKKQLLLATLILLISSCNMNPSKEERIQKLEKEVAESKAIIKDLQQKTEVQESKDTYDNSGMKLGAFSVSLSVNDLEVSKTFYEKLGFKQIGGSMEKNYLIMKNENSLIGLFQNMFEGNILTFNPGWDENGKDIPSFTDIREIQRELSSKGIEVGKAIDKDSTGPASFTLTDPDGNLILIDQHR